MELGKLEKLTHKQAMWIAEFYRTGNATEAAARVYNCKDRASAAQIGFENKQKLSQPVQKYAERLGIDLRFILKGFKQAAKATKIHTSHTEPDKVVPDYANRIKALKELAEIMGVKVTVQDGAANKPLNITFTSPELYEATKKRVSRLKK